LLVSFIADIEERGAMEL